MKSLYRISAVAFTALVLSALTGCAGIEYIPALMAASPTVPMATSPDPSFGSGLIALADKAAGYLAKLGSGGDTSDAPKSETSSQTPTQVAEDGLRHCPAPLATVAITADSELYEGNGPKDNFRRLAVETGCISIGSPSGSVPTVYASVSENQPMWTMRLEYTVEYSATIAGRTVNATGKASGSGSAYASSAKRAAEQAFARFVNKLQQSPVAKR